MGQSCVFVRLFGQKRPTLQGSVNPLLPNIQQSHAPSYPLCNIKILAAFSCLRLDVLIQERRRWQLYACKSQWRKTTDSALLVAAQQFSLQQNYKLNLAGASTIFRNFLVEVRNNATRSLPASKLRNRHLPSPMNMVVSTVTSPTQLAFSYLSRDPAYFDVSGNPDVE